MSIVIVNTLQLQVFTITIDTEKGHAFTRTFEPTELPVMAANFPWLLETQARSNVVQ